MASAFYWRLWGGNRIGDLKRVRRNVEFFGFMERRNDRG